jgi:hypothetical protein
MYFLERFSDALNKFEFKGKHILHKNFQIIKYIKPNIRLYFSFIVIRELAEDKLNTNID